jgi:hypothetical protein
LGLDKAERLNDAELSRILTFIDAGRYLKYIYLTHCLGIVGHGLEPISGSTAIVHIDLSTDARYGWSYQYKGSLCVDAAMEVFHQVPSSGGLCFSGHERESDDIL